MEESTPPPIKAVANRTVPKTRSRASKIVLKICVAFVALIVVFALILFRVYGLV